MCVLSLSLHASPQPLSISMFGGLSPPGYPSLLRSTLLFKHSQFDSHYFLIHPFKVVCNPLDTISLLCMIGELVGELCSYDGVDTSVVIVLLIILNDFE